MNNKDLSLDITYLFPNTMSTYGDNGNIIVLQKRCEWRNINVTVHYCDIYDSLVEADIYFWGGGQDKSQQIVSNSFNAKKIDFLTKEVDCNKVFLLICGSYQLMGKYYIDANNKKIDGIGILDIFTKSASKRMIGNTIIELNSKLNMPIKTIVGFENHVGQTFLGKEVEPLGYVKYGFGNNGVDKTEGAIYKNVIGCYQHGPLLPKNPHLADYIILKALTNKYGANVRILKLDDKLEYISQNAVIKKIGTSKQKYLRILQKISNLF